MKLRTRVLIAAAGCTTLALLAGIALLGARRAEPAAVTDVSLTGLVARSTADDSRGHLISVTGGRRLVSPLQCARVYAAAGTGLCLRQDGDLTTYQATVLDAHSAVRREIPLVGVPNRARVSPSGRLVAWTVFVTGDSYNGGRFSTRVGILDTRGGDIVPTLEDWPVTIGGHPYAAADLNFWGVTFAADDRTFYVTMSTAGHRYLMRGDLAAHTLSSVRDGVECPSLSPDGTRIAFKAAVGGDPARGWRPAVLTLATGQVTPLAETRDVDDQPAWVDERTVAYAIRRGGEHADVWAVPADGGGQPQMLLADAESPAAV